MDTTIPTLVQLHPPACCTCPLLPGHRLRTKCRNSAGEQEEFSKQMGSEPRFLQQRCHPNRLAGVNFTLFYFTLLLLSQILSLASASSIRQIGESALCPFEAKPDRDDSRVPALITQLTCRHAKSMVPNEDGGDSSAAPAGITCEQIGGTCKQIHMNLGVSYAKSSSVNRSQRSLKIRSRRSLRRHHNIRVNSACVCVLSNGKQAVSVGPNFEIR